jgi:S-adenosylmethionine:tRNA ribosyltransferase-isomerase
MSLNENDLETYSYDLPDELIAKTPPECRDQARLLVLDRAAGSIQHRSIRDLPELLSPGDCLVLNDTKVVPARLIGERTSTGGHWEGLYLSSSTEGVWQLIGQTRGRLLPGESITLHSIHNSAQPPLQLELDSQDDDGIWSARVRDDREKFTLLDLYGTVPLPPYIQRKVADDADCGRYQTTYAQHPGSVAAPTAGLHFTEDLFVRCQQRGIETARVTLHVGIGTFRPVSVSQLSEHRMHSEWCSVPDGTVQKIQQTRQRGGRIVAVGTTSVRTLESASQGGQLQAWSGATDLFIRPGHEFRAVDCLLTNFHLPKSTLLVLVSALAGTEFIREAYQAAVENRYRFFSYGDAMLIL